MLQKKNKIETPRLVIYCLEGCFAIFGIVFFALYLAGINFSIAPVPEGSKISSALTAILFSFLLILVELVFRYRFPLMLHVIYIAYCLASNIFGANLGLFRMEVPMMGEMLGWYDKVMHAILGYVLCVVAIFLSQKVKLYGKSTWGDILLILAISMGFASLWEIMEFTMDQIIPGQDMQRSSLIDTMLDMCAHFGLTIVFIIQYLIEKKLKVNLGIGFIERNLQTGYKMTKNNKNQQDEHADIDNIDESVNEEVA